MTKIDDTLNELGIDANSLPSGIAARKRKYDRLHSEFLKAVDEAGEEDFEKLQEIEASVEDYGEDLAEALITLGEKRAEKAEKERVQQERRKAREAKRKEKEDSAAAAAAAKKPEATPEPLKDAEPQTEPESAPASTATKPEAEMVNATGEEAEEIKADPEDLPEVEEESSGSGLSSILIGGLVLLTTFGAYNYFKRR